MKRFFLYLFSKSNLWLFLTAIFLSIIITSSFFIISDEYRLKFKYFYIFSGIFPNFLILILVARFIRYIYFAVLDLISSIFGQIFSNENYNKLENVVNKNRPKVKKIAKEISVKKNEKNLFWVAPIVALAIGILPMPLGYYMLSRLIVSAGALYFAFHFYKQNVNFKVWIFGFLVVLYNPILPIHLNEKEIWILVNIPTMYYFYLNRKFMR